MYAYLVMFSAVLYLAFIISLTFSKIPLKWSEHLLENRLARAGFAALSWPVVALLFLLFGLIGKFMLLPIFELL